MKKFYLLPLTALMMSCSHMTMVVSSNPPDADVTLITKTGAQQLGKTPLSIDSSRLNNIGDGFTLEISKNGHFQQRVVVEKRSLASTGEITVKLAQHPKFDFKKNDPDVKAAIEQIARSVSTIQSMLLKREYNQAEVLAKTLLNEYPNLAVGWNLLGNNYYLQGRYEEAASHYNKALEIEPANQETRDVLSRMNRIPAETQKER